MNETNITTDLAQSIESLFKKQKAAQQKIKDSTLDERLEKLKKLKAAIIKYKDEVADAIYQDFQRPKAASYAIEIGLITSHLDYTIKHLPEWIKNEPLQPASADANFPYTAEIVYEPKGTVLIIGPWNVPFFLTLYPLISSIAGGNTSVIKPSEMTPHNSAVIKRIIEETFDEEEVAVVEGGVPETTELLALPFDHIYFTGSPKVAKIVMKAAAENLASVTLELGGKSPAIIDETADFDKAVYKIIKAKSLNAGQICMDVDYVLVPEKLLGVFVEKANAFLQEAYYGKGSFNYDDYDQIINDANFARLKHLFDDAVEMGAHVAVGGEFEASLRKIQPTVLTNVSTDMKIMKEEIFGPLLPVIAYKSKEEAAEIIRNIEKPLGFYIFSEDKNFIDYMITHSTSGGVSVNDVMLHAFDPAFPFGGVNTSGIGKGYGKYGFHELTNARTVMHQHPDLPNDEFLKAPYEGKAEVIRELFQ